MDVVLTTVFAVLTLAGLIGILASGAFFSRRVGVPAGVAVTLSALATVFLAREYLLMVLLYGVLALIAGLVTLAATGGEK